jgi:hypothetical protein
MLGYPFLQIQQQRTNAAREFKYIHNVVLKYHSRNNMQAGLIKQASVARCKSHWMLYVLGKPQTRYCHFIPFDKYVGTMLFSPRDDGAILHPAADFS